MSWKAANEARLHKQHKITTTNTHVAKVLKTSLAHKHEAHMSSPSKIRKGLSSAHLHLGAHHSHKKK